MIFLTFLASFISGICASMGLGGGSVLILFLTLFLGVDRIMAGGVNLIFFIPVALVSVLMSLKNKSYNLKEILPYILSGVLFSIPGIAFAIYLKSKWVSYLFATFLLFIGIKEGLSALRDKK